LFVGASAAIWTHKEPVAGAYIVIFNQGLSAEAIAAHKSFVPKYNVTINRHYSIGRNFNGYAAQMSEETAELLSQLSDVAYVEEDSVVRATQVPCTTQSGSTWGLVRTSQQMLDLDGNYFYTDGASGDGVTVYVIDTGILLSHNEFFSGGVSRAKWGTNTIDTINLDENGHGTHCAGTIGGTVYGMAKKARLVAVKVLNRAGSGTMASVISGVDWSHHTATSEGVPSVASMSLGGGKSQALNDAVDAAAEDPQHPLITVVAAGNNNGDAANYSPASARSAITIAASDNTDRKAAFSNWGRGVTCWAPGVAVTSAWIGSNTATNTISGTSMACPHVAGQVAKFLQTDKRATTAETKAWIQSEASEGLIINGGIGGTPNLLMFADCNTWAGVRSNSTLKLQKRY